MMAATYSIIRSEKVQGSVKPVHTTVERGLSWKEADTKRNAMQLAEDEAFPGRSSWTKTLFLIEMEKPEGKGKQ